MGEYLQGEEFTNGKDGEIQFIKDGLIIPVYGSSKFKASSTPKVITRGQIGTRRLISKPTSFENKITLTADYYMVGVMTDWLLEFKATGKWPKIDLMAVNHDKGTSLGRMSKVYFDLVPDGEISLQELDESNESGLTTELTFKFSDWDSLSNFTLPTNIGRE